MSISATRVVLPAAIALCATYLPDTASAADIASVIGPVGSGTWEGNCPTMNEDEPNGTSQLPNCPGGGATCLHRVVLDPVEFPEATCSDGTPGVFYVRAGTDDPNRWVIHLQGGGNCRDYGECLERWCGQQGLLPYTANKMSSDWDADGITDVHAHVVGPGMASANPDNEFSTWTHVWAYYCSSDNWQGTESDVEFTDGADSFALDTRGRTILHAMRNMLRKNNSDINWTAEGNNPVPDLDDATEIVFTGTSAGGQGAMANADWFLVPFSDSDNSLVVDAQFEIHAATTVIEDIRVDTDLDGAGDDFWSNVMIQMIQDMWDVDGYYDLIDAVHDQDCMDEYYDDGAMDRCDIAPLLFLLDHAFGPMIETPTFVRLDLEDEVLSRVYRMHPNPMGTSLHVGPGFGAPPTTMDDYARLARISLLLAYDDHDSVTGLFAPRCGDHVGLEDNNAFAVVTTPDTDDVTMVPVANSDTTMHDALWEWLNVGGGGTRNDVRYLDTDAPGGSNSGC